MKCWRGWGACRRSVQSCGLSPSRAAIRYCCARRAASGVAIWPLALALHATYPASPVIICFGTRGAKLASPYAAHVTQSGMVQSNKVCMPQEVLLVSTDLALRQMNVIRFR